MFVTKDNLKIKSIEESKNMGIYEFDPLPTGFGTTLGNSLRRVLMTEIEGAAATSVKINGITHQFTTIPGLQEDIVELTLNLKRIRFKLHTDKPVVVTLSKKGPGEVKAGDIKTNSDIDVINKDLHIANLANNKSELIIEFVVESGTGYSPMEERQTNKVGVIVLDALFSPIVRVNYSVEPTRFGSRTDLDKLLLTVETDGTVLPYDAIKKASVILIDYYTKLSEGLTKEEKIEIEEKSDTASAGDFGSSENVAVEDLPLQTRTINALKKYGINTLHELAAKTDEEISDIKNLGEKSIGEIKKLLNR